MQLSDTPYTTQLHTPMQLSDTQYRKKEETKDSQRTPAGASLGKSPKKPAKESEPPTPRKRNLVFDAVVRGSLEEDPDQLGNRGSFIGEILYGSKKKKKDLVGLIEFLTKGEQNPSEATLADLATLLDRAYAWHKANKLAAPLSAIAIYGMVQRYKASLAYLRDNDAAPTKRIVFIDNPDGTTEAREVYEPERTNVN